MPKLGDLSSKIFQRGNNPINMIKDVKRKQAEQALAEKKVESLDQISSQPGDQVGGRFISPDSTSVDANGNLVSEPTNASFIGAFQSGRGETFQGGTYQIGAVYRGKIGAGLNNLGQFLWQFGNGILDKLGITIGVGDAIFLGGYGVIGSSQAGATPTPVLGLENYNTSATNQLTNGGFETGDFTGWTTSGSPSILSTDPYEGTYYASLPNTAFIQQTIGSFSGKHPVCIFWHKGPQVTLTLELLDAGSINVSTRTTVFPSSNEWVRCSTGIYNDFSTATQGKISLTSNGASCLLDSVSLLRLDDYVGLFIGEVYNTNKDIVRFRGRKVVLGNGSASDNAAMLDVRGSAALSSYLNEAQGANIASASTTDIGAATGNYVKVTGTTTITSLGTVQAGTRRIVEFTGALTLTHNVTSLILPGAANIATVAGDVAMFVSLGSGNWKCVAYLRSANSPATGSNTGDVTIGTANGLSLAGQVLSLALAVAGGANGALSGTDKTKLDNTSGTNTGDQTLRTPIYLSGLGNTVPGSSTNYLGMHPQAPNATEANVQAQAPFAGTMRNLRFRTLTAQPAGGNMVVTLRVGLADTSVTFTIAAGAAAGTFSDVSNTAAVTAAQAQSLKCVNNAAGASAQIGAVSLETDA
jgi:hypothetical protein